ncbi:MAG: 16S rRNA (guanine(966)-N(2))-methyltransferase RsmD [Chloroflexota bacterium]
MSRGSGDAGDPRATESRSRTGSAGRVIAGSARGIRLAAPGEGTRPLADRVKQTLFAILEPDLPGAHVLDLFAGSGAGGIEALSRGAAGAVFVERDPGAVATIRANLARTHLAGPRALVVQAEARRWLASPLAPAAGPFDVILLDPPYDRPELLPETLQSLAEGRLLGRRSVVVVKHFWKDRPAARIGLLRSVRERRFGETALTFYRAAGTDEEEA